MTTSPKPPEVFLSYSWDGEDHENWVVQLATDLRSFGIDVYLDRFDTRLGSDLTLFMQHAADPNKRVLVVCTPNYAAKADAGQGGVGFERRMLTPDLMRTIDTERIIPLVRDNPDAVVPLFLRGVRYIDFRNNATYRETLVELLHELHGRPKLAKPALGPNPFTTTSTEDEARTAVLHSPTLYRTPLDHGTVTFDHTNNDGRYQIGSGDHTFTIDTSTSGHGSVLVYDDPADIKTIALVPGATRPADIGNPYDHDTSSRSRRPRVGDAVVLRNQHDYWAAIFIDEVLTRDTNPDGTPLLTFRYVILTDHSHHFGAAGND